MKTLFRFLGMITAIIIVSLIIVLNTGLAHINLVFIKGDIAVFLIIMASFVCGFICGLIFVGLKKITKPKKKPKKEIETRTDLIGEI
ncbi:MAG: LapA family protein [Desulfobacterales bacterium]|nr:LapA family protein [Desulfobacterales bacterium]